MRTVILGSVAGRYTGGWTVGKNACALTRPKHGSPLKSWRTSSGSVSRTMPPPSGNSYGTQYRAGSPSATSNGLLTGAFTVRAGLISNSPGLKGWRRTCWGMRRTACRVEREAPVQPQGMNLPRTCNAEGAGEPSLQPRKALRSVFHDGSRHERGARGRLFPLLHMHYVGRSFRLLNPFASVRAPSERFSGRKFHRTEIFCRKPKGKRGDPRGRTNFDEEGEKRFRSGLFPCRLPAALFILTSPLKSRRRTG